MSDQAAKATTFQALHQRPGPFVLPNPWDAGSARLLEHWGFEALATTSLGVANMHGQRGATKQQVLENVRVIAAATTLPANADLEDGFATEPAAICMKRMGKSDWRLFGDSPVVPDLIRRDQGTHTLLPNTLHPCSWISTLNTGLSIEAVAKVCVPANVLP